jgi:beta-lactamase superfamily II metal-dependent hydrolase
VRLPENRWVLATDGDSFSTMRTIRLLQKEGINRLHALIVSDTQADTEALRQLQDIFHPQQIQQDDGKEISGWPAGEGSVCISPGR